VGPDCPLRRTVDPVSARAPTAGNCHAHSPGFDPRGDEHAPAQQERDRHAKTERDVDDTHGQQHIRSDWLGDSDVIGYSHSLRDVRDLDGDHAAEHPLSR
jgi:hypothetical protein